MTHDEKLCKKYMIISLRTDRSGKYAFQSVVFPRKSISPMSFDSFIDEMLDETFSSSRNEHRLR